MIAFKCKICGGNLEIEQGERISTCSSCGSTHSLPSLNNDKVKNLYERANQLRGEWHSSALSSTGRVFTWGYNFNGQLGDGTNTNRNVPTEIQINS